MKITYIAREWTCHAATSVGYEAAGQFHQVAECSGFGRTCEEAQATAEQIATALNRGQDAGRCGRRAETTTREDMQRLSARERARAYEVAPGRPTDASERASAFHRHMPARDARVIDAALAILERDLTERPVFSSSAAAKQYLRLQLGDQVRENFGVMCLDAQSRLIAFEIVATGTLTEAPVYPREVVLRALAHGAASVVLAHNHPTGQVSPSSADKAMTQTLKAALALVGVRVVDHVIVSARDAFSMADADLIQ